MSELGDGIRVVGKAFIDNWIMIGGVFSTLWYALVRLRRMAFKDYVTTTQMSNCKNEIVAKIEASASERVKQIEMLRMEQSESRAENAQQHEDILKKIIDALHARN